MKYEVTVIRKLSRTGSVVVEATSANDARAQVEMKITGGRIHYDEETRVDDEYIVDIVDITPS